MLLQFFTKFLTIYRGFYEQTTIIRHFIHFETYASALYGTYRNIGIAWVCKEGGGRGTPAQYFFLHKNIYFILFLEYRFLEGQVNNYKNFPNDHLGGVRSETKKNLRFKGGRIEES